MPINELRAWAREAWMEKRVEQLALTYKNARKSLVKKLQDIDITSFQKARAEALLAQVDAEIQALNVEARKWAKGNMMYGYEHGLHLAEDDLKRLKVTKAVRFDSQIHKDAVTLLVDNTTLDLLTANGTIKQQVTRFVRQTQQQVIEDSQISKRIAEGMIEGETRKQISDKILSDFTKQLDEGKFITVNGRNYDPEAYSRLVARSRFTEASNNANVNAALQYGVDLVQVSVNSGSCDICDEFQGKIFSISGNDPDFPALEDRPPYHPNCRHQLLPVTRESLEDRGTLAGQISFSNSMEKVETFRQLEEVVGV